MTTDERVRQQRALNTRTADLKLLARDVAELPPGAPEHNILRDHLAHHRRRLDEFRHLCMRLGVDAGLDD